jgi:hypothetical protein
MTREVYLICYDIDNGYDVMAAFDDKELADSELEKLKAAYIKERFYNEPIPDNVDEHIPYFMGNCIINDTSKITKRIELLDNFLKLRTNPNYYGTINPTENRVS